MSMRTLLLAAALAQALDYSAVRWGPSRQQKKRGIPQNHGFAALKKELDRSLREKWFKGRRPQTPALRAGESLDMAKSPFRLLAIVNRLDLRKTDSAGEFHAGEGRFVFGLVDVEAGCMPLEFVVIFEYGQRAESVEEIQDTFLKSKLGFGDSGASANQAINVSPSGGPGGGDTASRKVTAQKGTSIVEYLTHVVQNSKFILNQFDASNDTKDEVAQVSEQNSNKVSDNEGAQGEN